MENGTFRDLECNGIDQRRIQQGRMDDTNGRIEPY